MLTYSSDPFHSNSDMGQNMGPHPETEHNQRIPKPHGSGILRLHGSRSFPTGALGFDRALTRTNSSTHPGCAAVPVSPLCPKNAPPERFLNGQTLTGSNPSRSKKRFGPCLKAKSEPLWLRGRISLRELRDLNPRPSCYEEVSRLETGSIAGFLALFTPKIRGNPKVIWSLLQVSFSCSGSDCGSGRKWEKNMGQRIRHLTKELFRTQSLRKSKLCFSPFYARIILVILSRAP